MKSDDNDNVSETIKTNSSKYELDSLLREIGQWGKFQIFIFIMIAIPIILSGTFAFSFVFAAGDLNYRCEIPQCDGNNDVSVYKPEWLSNAVPFNGEKPALCVHYEFVNYTDITNQCYDQDDFNRANQMSCSDKFVWEDEENTIVKEFNLTCDEHKWMITLIGTVHYAAHFLNLMCTGFFSDKYGRKVVFIFSTLASGSFGIIRSFSTSYVSFIVLEFIDSFLGAGVYTAGFIMAVEILSPEYRALGGTIMFCCAAIGKSILGVTAMWYLDWKLLLQINCAPAFLTIAYYWILPESVRWLLSQKRHEDAAKILLKASKINNDKLSEDSIEMLKNRSEEITLGVAKPEPEIPVAKETFKNVFDHPAMLMRLIICSYCWLTNVFVFYGLSLAAVAIGGNKFTDYFIASIIEIPANILVILLINRYGRKKLLCISLVLSGVALLASTVTPDEYWLNLTLFLIGKFAITVSFSTIYIYTSELFPTNLRHTLLGICSAFGRIGSIVAPQAPLLADVMTELPSILFGGTALLAGALAMTFPETLNVKLPDTITEALGIGKENQDTDDERKSTGKEIEMKDC